MVPKCNSSNILNYTFWDMPGPLSGTGICGDRVEGDYVDTTVDGVTDFTLMLNIPHGELTLDKTKCAFDVAFINVYDESDTFLFTNWGAPDGGHSIRIWSFPALMAPGNYKFKLCIDAPESGTYDISTICITYPTDYPSASPTFSPSMPPTQQTSQSTTTSPTNKTDVMETTYPPSISTTTTNTNMPTIRPSESIYPVAGSDGGSESIITWASVTLTAIVLLICCVCGCIIWIVSRVCKSWQLRKQNMTGEDEVQIMMPGMAPVHGVVSIEDDVNRTRGQENDLVISWLQKVVRLPQFIPNFLENGFESMGVIAHIENKRDLMEIGILSKDHQTLIMKQIAKLKVDGMQDDGEQLEEQLRQTSTFVMFTSEGERMSSSDDGDTQMTTTSKEDNLRKQKKNQSNCQNTTTSNTKIY
eukprot:263648_1